MEETKGPSTMESKQPTKTRVYGHGIHDFCQRGHDRDFMEAKYALPNAHLLIGMIQDKTIQENKEKLINLQNEFKMLYNELERYESILHCRHVDDIICDAPWQLNGEFLDKNKIDFVAITDRQTKEFFQNDQFFDKLKENGKLLILQDNQNTITTSKQPPRDLAKEENLMAPFSDDPLAIERRNKCSYDFNNRISLQSAKDVSITTRPIRVYADGIYDMFHPGHARQLRQAKNAFQNVHLVVGVVNDELTDRYKGPTVVPEGWRYDRVRHCRYVDEVIRDAPWVITNDFLIRNKIDFVAHDDIPYKFEGQEDVYKEIKELGMFLVTQRMEGISTTDLKIRLKRESSS